MFPWAELASPTQGPFCLVGGGGAGRAAPPCLTVRSPAPVGSTVPQSVTPTGCPRGAHFKARKQEYLRQGGRRSGMTRAGL